MSYKLLRLSFLFLLIFSGCTKETTEGNTTIFTFELWVGLIATLVAIAGTIIGFFIKDKWNWGWGMLIVGPIFLLTIIPGLFLDKVTVNAEHFTLKTGFWFSPTKHDVTYADLSQIDFTEEVKRGRRGRKNHSYYLICHKKSGEQQKVPVGDLMKKAVAKLLAQADDQGIQVIHLRP